MDPDEKGAIAVGPDIDLLDKYRSIRKLNWHKMEPTPLLKKSS